MIPKSEVVGLRILQALRTPWVTSDDAAHPGRTGPGWSRCRIFLELEMGPVVELASAGLTMAEEPVPGLARYPEDEIGLWARSPDLETVAEIVFCPEYDCVAVALADGSFLMSQALAEGNNRLVRSRFGAWAPDGAPPEWITWWERVPWRP